jgi:hypothetical protein
VQQTVDQPTAQVLPFPDRRSPAEPDKVPEPAPRPARPMTPAFMPPGAVSGRGPVPPVVTRKASSPPSDVPEYKAPAPVAATVKVTVDQPEKRKAGRQLDPIKSVEKLKIVAFARIKDALANPDRSLASVRARVEPIWMMLKLDEFEGGREKAIQSFRAIVWDRLQKKAKEAGFDLDGITWEVLTGLDGPRDPHPPNGGATITPPVQNAPDGAAIDSATPDGAAPETPPETGAATSAAPAGDQVAITTGAQLEAAISAAETHWSKAGYSVATVFQALAPIFEKTSNDLNGTFYGRIANLATMCASTPKPPGISWPIFWDGVEFCYGDAIELHVGTYPDDEPPKGGSSPTPPVQDAPDGDAIDSATPDEPLAETPPETSPETGAKKTPAINRLAIIQSIAATLYGRMPICMVGGSLDGIRVDAFDDAKKLFCRALLKPHPEIEDQFGLRIMARHEGKFLTEEGETFETAKIRDDIEWALELSAEAKSTLLADCKIAKAKGVKRPYIFVDGEKLTITAEPRSDDGWSFILRDLEWVLRKRMTTISFSQRGIIRVRAGDGHENEYEFFLRGRPR